jgi:hypothetical protein
MIVNISSAETFLTFNKVMPNPVLNTPYIRYKPYNRNTKIFVDVMLQLYMFIR